MIRRGILWAAVLFSVTVNAQTILRADGEGDTYELINSVLAPSGNVVEVPDCGHTAFGRHIDEVYDSTLHEWVFRFHIHVHEDNDRCKNYDRQRNEIKTYDQSPDSTLGVQGETFTYKWKFRLDTGHQSSSSFTHIHQLKAVGGPEESMPLITLTTRKGSPDKLELRYARTTSQTTIYSKELDPMKGVWIQATEIVKYGETGTYSVMLESIESGDTLFNYSNNNIRMWKTNANFIRPKYGIYRSLNDSVSLRDEQLLYNDFYILEEPAVIIPDTTRPEVEISTEAAEPVSDTFEVEIGFTEAISGLTEENILVEGGVLVNGSLLTENNLDYAIQIVPQLNDTVIVQIPDSVATDNAGNYNRASNILEILAETPSMLLSKEQAIIQIYPNPLKGDLITIHNPHNVAHSALEIISLSGKKVASYQNLSAGYFEINVSTLSNGIYLALFTADSFTEYHRLVITR